MQWIVLLVLAIVAVMVIGFLLHLVKWVLIIALVVVLVGVVVRALPGGRSDP